MVVSFPWEDSYQSSVGVHSKVLELNLAMLLPLSFPVTVTGWMTVEKVLWDHLTNPTRHQKMQLSSGVRVVLVRACVSNSASVTLW